MTSTAVLKFKTSLVHKITELYKNIYLFSRQISKKDRYGIYQRIEDNCLSIAESLLTACFEEKENKLAVLYPARVKIEVLKRLIRIANELNIINTGKYLGFQLKLEEISKMTNGWIKYVEEKLADKEIPN